MKREGENTNHNSSGTASVIFGILSIPTSLAPFVGIFFGILGLVFGIVQARSHKNKWSTWGIVLSVLGIVFSIAIFALAISVLSDPAFYEQIQQSMSQGAY